MKIEYQNLPSDRKFGLFFSIVFLITIFIFGDNVISFFEYLFFFLSLIFLILSLVYPVILRPLNYLWFLIGYILGKIISPIIIGIIFYIIITPISIVLFFIGRDELKIKLNNKNSYWIKRNDKEYELEDLKKQY